MSTIMTGFRWLSISFCLFVHWMKVALALEGLICVCVFLGYLLVEQHGEHHLVGLLGQVGEEEDLVRRLLWDAGRCSGLHRLTRWS